MFFVTKDSYIDRNREKNWTSTQVALVGRMAGMQMKDSCVLKSWKSSTG